MISKDFGEGYRLFILESEGLRLAVTDLGATLVSLEVKGPAGDTDVVLGYDDAAGYLRDKGTYFGANVGRVANRIAGARFELDGKTYRLDSNDGANCLHSGFSPYNVRRYETVSSDDNHISFALKSPDGDQGFPGNLDLTITYRLLGAHGFEIVFIAVSDTATPVSLTNHSYFNLDGEGSDSILGHSLQLRSSAFTPADRTSICHGEVRSVSGTPMDFQNEKTIGRDIEATYDALVYGRGYDHNYLVEPDISRPFAIARGEKSGIVLTVASDYPGVQFYSGNFLDGVDGKNGHVYRHRSAFCLEPQYYPNAVNVKSFPSPILEQGVKSVHRIVYTLRRPE